MMHTKFMVSVSRDGTAEIDAYPQDWAHFAVNQLEGAVNDAFRAVTGTKSSWDQAAWHAFSEKLPYADRENGWTREHDAYLQSVYPLPDARDISWKEALAAVLADAGRTDTENGNHVLLEIDGRHVWKITLPDLADAGWRSGGTSWQIDARTGEILERAVWDLGDSAWRAYVPDSVYAAVRQGMLTGRGMIDDHPILAKSMGPDTSVGVHNGKMRPGPITVASLRTEDGRLKGFVTEGDVTTLNSGKGFFGTGFVFRKADGDMNGFFNYMAENGYRHHVAFAYGRNANVVREGLVKYLDYEIDLM